MTEISAKINKGKNVTIEVKADEKILGSSNASTSTYLFSQLMNVIGHSTEREDGPKLMRTVMPLLQAIDPKDELEGMLTVQIVSIHSMATEMMRRAMYADQTVNGVNYNINRVAKLARIFLAQMEALDKHRGKGQQKITVEHVTVNEGGQAIVGSVAGGKGCK